MHCELNAADCGLPQDRKRAYFSAIHRNVAHGMNPAHFEDLIELLKLPEPLPIERFLLPPDHPYLQKVMAERQLAAIRNMKTMIDSGFYLRRSIKH